MQQHIDEQLQLMILPLKALYKVRLVCENISQIGQFVLYGRFELILVRNGLVASCGAGGRWTRKRWMIVLLLVVRVDCC